MIKIVVDYFSVIIIIVTCHCSRMLASKLSFLELSEMQMDVRLLSLTASAQKQIYQTNI